MTNDGSNILLLLLRVYLTLHTCTACFSFIEYSNRPEASASVSWVVILVYYNPKNDYYIAINPKATLQQRFMTVIYEVGFADT